jgi:Na+-transporting NADH:ubiquinone oxidoreductase subunit NqrF
MTKIAPLTSRQIAMIVGNIRKVMTTHDSRQLTKQAYNFLYLASGFIAHYSLYGFQDAYANVDELAANILNNKANNQWGNFRLGEDMYDYYMSKKGCYNAICKMLEDLGYKATRPNGWGW